MLKPNKKQTLFAVYYPQYFVVVPARRPSPRLAKNNLANLSLLLIRNQYKEARLQRLSQRPYQPCI